MSEFYDEYTDDEYENTTLELSKTAEKYQKMIDENLEETKELATSATQLKQTEEVLNQVHTKGARQNLPAREYMCQELLCEDSTPQQLVRIGAPPKRSLWALGM